MGEKTEATKWAMLWMFIVIVFLLAMTVLGWVLLPAQKAVERKVLENSFQYQYGIEDRVSTLEAALAEIDARLSFGPDTETRKSLEIQRSTINAQLSAARRMHK